MLYACEDGGIKESCDTAPSGQRICPDCGKDVTGIVLQTRDTTRSPPEGEAQYMEGSIEWDVVLGYSGRGFTVSAFDYRDAAEAAANRVKNPQEIRKIRPRNLRYRGP